MKVFYCECGMVIPLGTPVIKQIKHKEGSYHKKRMEHFELFNRKEGKG